MGNNIKRPALWFSYNVPMTNVLVKLCNEMIFSKADSYDELPQEVRDIMTEVQYNIMTEEPWRISSVW